MRAKTHDVLHLSWYSAPFIAYIQMKHIVVSRRPVSVHLFNRCTDLNQIWEGGFLEQMETSHF